MTGNQARPIPAEEVEGVCMNCHDGRRAPAEPHPVGRRFERMKSPEGWPAPDNKVTCVTCHQVHPDRRYGAPRPTVNAMFLRDYRGDLLAFCARCHPGAEEPQLRYNPHAVQAQSGRIVEQSCTFCHAKPMPAGTRATRTGNPSLRASPILICISCHTTHLEWSQQGHIGAKATPAVLAALDAFSESHAQEEARPSAGYLPLYGGQTVTCGTCHNPHQEGVFPAGSVLAAGAIRPGQQTEQLRGLGKELCGACHAK